MTAVCHRYGLNPAMPVGVKEADMVMLATEVRDLLPKPTAGAKKVWKPWLEGITPLKETIYPWDWKKAEREFLKRFVRLARKLEEEGT